MSEPFFNSTQSGSPLQVEELFSLIDPIFNNSSQGESYTDVAGDTYGTTASQTSFTAPAFQTGITATQEALLGANDLRGYGLS